MNGDYKNGVCTDCKSSCFKFNYGGDYPYPYTYAGITSIRGYYEEKDFESVCKPKCFSPTEDSCKKAKGNNATYIKSGQFHRWMKYSKDVMLDGYDWCIGGWPTP